MTLRVRRYRPAKVSIENSHSPGLAVQEQVVSGIGLPPLGDRPVRLTGSFVQTRDDRVQPSEPAGAAAPIR